MADKANIPKVIEIPQTGDIDSSISRTIDSMTVISMKPEDAAVHDSASASEKFIYGSRLPPSRLVFLSSETFHPFPYEKGIQKHQRTDYSHNSQCRQRIINEKRNQEYDEQKSRRKDVKQGKNHPRGESHRHGIHLVGKVRTVRLPYEQKTSSGKIHQYRIRQAGIKGKDEAASESRKENDCQTFDDYECQSRNRNRKDRARGTVLFQDTGKYRYENNYSCKIEDRPQKQGSRHEPAFLPEPVWND